MTKISEALLRDLFQGGGGGAVTQFVRSAVIKRTVLATEVLFLCDWSGNLELLDAILNAGIDVNVVNRWGQTPLYNAAAVRFPWEEPSKVALCQRLIVAGADVNMQHTIRYEAPPRVVRGDTALMSAARTDSTKIIQSLMMAGADLSIRDSKGLTALDHAKVLGNKRAYALLNRSGT